MAQRCLFLLLGHNESMGVCVCVIFCVCCCLLKMIMLLLRLAGDNVLCHLRVEANTALDWCFVLQTEIDSIDIDTCAV